MSASDLRATWTRAWLTLLAPIFLVMLVRWCLFEPFVIPSGSMIPTLFIHDHIAAQKWAYGLHLPFVSKYIWQWSKPQHGDVIVFRYPKNPEVFFVKRVIASEGEEIAVNHGVLYLNGNRIEQEMISEPSETLLGGVLPLEKDSFSYYHEGHHLVRYLEHEESFFHPLKVPPGQLFVMGDNRDQSSDSRVWGFVPQENVVGRVRRIWLACTETLPSASYLCNPRAIQWRRIWFPVE